MFVFNRSELANFAAFFSERIEPEPIGPTLRRRYRASLFSEGFRLWIRRLACVAAHLIEPVRTRELIWLAASLLIRRGPVSPLSALSSAHGGRVTPAADLSPATMMEAYCHGLTPCTVLGPIAWTSRPVRSVSSPGSLPGHLISRRRRPGSIGAFAIDRNFENVLAQCARTGRARAVLSPRLLLAFAGLSDAGFAHCFELRDTSDAVIAGGFGVAFGGVFVLEGLFENRDGAAAIGLARFAGVLHEMRFALVERAPHAEWLCTQAFAPMPRNDYLAAIMKHRGRDRIGKWRTEHTPRLRLNPSPPCGDSNPAIKRRSVVVSNRPQRTAGADFAAGLWRQRGAA
jgi:leucyl/phenylalanyl-tRNA--protein transferase